MFFKSTESVSVTEAAEKIGAPDTMFIDVRTPAEYAGGHAASAINYSLQDIDDAEVAKLKSQDAVYVICQSGGRSAAAVALLKESGVHAVNVEGGTTAWQAAGLPMA